MVNGNGLSDFSTRMNFKSFKDMCLAYISMFILYIQYYHITIWKYLKLFKTHYFLDRFVLFNAVTFYNRINIVVYE